MKEGNTTLSVPKDFASTLREDYNGHNDLERLENWKSEDTNDSYNEDITREDLKEIIQDIEIMAESNNNSITMTELENTLERLTIDGRTGEVMLE